MKPTTVVQIPGGKVTEIHRDRSAIVYVRQSTRHQVAVNAESTRLQYALADRAVALGWARHRVLVIDEDLGRSGAGTADRPGFQRLVAEVTLNHVGLVLGIEVSRLARSERDWCQLLELCALWGVLLADADGVYDPADYNDRLLLGLKGTMSAAELHWIKQRMLTGRINKALRGDLQVPLPVGYIRRPSGEAALDPDERVQEVVRLVFDKFDEIGAVHGVLRWFVDHRVQIPMRIRGGLRKGDLEWRRPNRGTLRNILQHPVYAGIYVYGRSRLDPRRRIADRPSSGHVQLPEQEWTVMIEDAMPAYITAERWRANRVRMAANAPTGFTPGAVRDGSGLLAGLVYCGHCGCRMAMMYHSERGWRAAAYACTTGSSTYGQPHRCQTVTARYIDEKVAGWLLEVLAPAGLEVALAAADRLEAERADEQRLWSLRLEHAQYTVDRAQRCYQLAEPENRLVVRQLEHDWEHALAVQQTLTEEHDRFIRARPKHLTPDERIKIAALAGDLPGLWHASSTTDADRKEILRAVIDKVEVAVVGSTEQIDITVHWAGGQTTTGHTVRRVQTLTQLSYYPQLLDHVCNLAAQGLTPSQIARALNAEGRFRPTDPNRRFGRTGVNDMLRSRGLLQQSPTTRAMNAAAGPLHDHEWYLSDLAIAAGVCRSTVMTRLRQGELTGRQEARHPHRWIISADQQQLHELREHSQAPRRRAPAAPRPS